MVLNWWLALLISFVWQNHIFAKNEETKLIKFSKIEMSKEIKDAGKICLKPNKRHEASGRILGGVFAPKKAFPWMAAVYQFNNDKESEDKFAYFTSAGSIISKNYVLTCAHSVAGMIAKDFFVRLGDYNLLSPHDDRKRGVINRKIKNFIVHEQYEKPDTHSNDIALLRLNDSIKFTRFIKPICVPGLNVPFRKLQRSQLVSASGWGQTEKEGETFSPSLRHVNLHVFEMAICELKSRISPVDENMFICAGSWETRMIKDTCFGDSGGPLMPMRNHTPEPILVGIVSHGSSESCLGIGFYTNVSNYAKWIAKNAK